MLLLILQFPLAPVSAGLLHGVLVCLGFVTRSTLIAGHLLAREGLILRRTHCEEAKAEAVPWGHHVTDVLSTQLQSWLGVIFMAADVWSGQKKATRGNF